MALPMSVNLRSYAKINIGLKIGRRRGDGFHELRTLYTTIAMSERVRVEVAEGEGITVHCEDPRVPCDETNTCYKAAQKTLAALGRNRTKANVFIEKELPVQGGLGAASGNAVATILGLENALSSRLTPQIRAKIASEIGSDLNLFLYGGLVLGTGRGEEVWPLPDLPSLPLVVVTPEVGVSTPKAFEDWDALTPPPDGSATINEFNRCGLRVVGRDSPQQDPVFPPRAGTGPRHCFSTLSEPGFRTTSNALSFQKFPYLREVKRVLEREGAVYASLSGSGLDRVWIVPNDSEAAGQPLRVERERE